MSKQGKTFWDPSKRAAYLSQATAKAAASQRRKDGHETAGKLDQLLAGLGSPQREVLNALLTTGRRTFIAPHDLPDLRELVAMGLLAYPRGQGGQWMRAASTSYTVPPAVWEKLQGGIPVSEGPNDPGNDCRLQKATILLDALTSGKPVHRP